MAQGPAETNTVIMALNLLIPIGLQIDGVADAASLSAAAMQFTQGGAANALLSSLDVGGANNVLANYIDANAMMLLDFLRVRIASRKVTSEDKAIALHSLHQLLRVLEADGSVLVLEVRAAVACACDW